MRIGVLTSGGDAPGMNAAIRACVRTVVGLGGEAFGVTDGFRGLMAGAISPLGARSVGGILELGGTILGSARAPQFKTDAGVAAAAAAIRRAELDGLIVIGGNGSQSGANALHAVGVPVVGIASTIDNDLVGADVSIGFDTALNITIEAIDRLRTTASSHHRAFVIETMGNHSGFLPLMAGLAGGAEAIVTPEMDMSAEELLEIIHRANERGKKHVLVVVSEWAHHHARALHQALCRDAGIEYDPRLTVLGHVVRGGAPTASDRILASRLGAAAVREIASGRFGNLVGLVESRVCTTPLQEVAGRAKALPAELVQLAASMTI